MLFFMVEVMWQCMRCLSKIKLQGKIFLSIPFFKVFLKRHKKQNKRIELYSAEGILKSQKLET